MKYLLSIGLLILPLLSCSEVAQPAMAQSPRRQFALIALGEPRSIAVDRGGNLYVVDVDFGTMHRITLAGEVSDFGRSGSSVINAPIGLSVAPDGAILVADADENAVYRVSPGGCVSALAKPSGEASFSTPTSAAADSAGNVFVANNTSHTILKITSAGFASVFAGKREESGSADGVGSAARFGTPLGIAVDAKDNLYVADSGNCNIRKITPAGVVSTLAGEAGKSGSVDGAGSVARFSAPRGLAVDAGGTVYVADTDNHCIRKITPEGVVSTLAGQAGNAERADGVGSAARFNQPRSVAVDTLGNVYVADGGNRAIRLISTDGVVTTIAAAAPFTAAAASATLREPPVIPPQTGQSERFDYSHAQTLDGWDADPAYWSVKDGVFVATGQGVQSNFLLTKKNYSDFRLTLSSQVVDSDNHAGICLWGERTVSFNGWNKWAYRGPLLMFPGLGLWDYDTNKSIPVDPAGKALAKKIAGQHDWLHIEILAQGNRLRVAYNGQQVLDWREPNPSGIKVGPIGLQLHGFAKHQQVVYKDVAIETFPKDDRLITVKE